MTKRSVCAYLHVMRIFGRRRDDLVQDHEQNGNDHEDDLSVNGINPHYDSNVSNVESIDDPNVSDNDANLSDDSNNDTDHPREDSIIDPIRRSSSILDLNRYNDSPIRDLNPEKSAVLLYTILHDYDQSVSIHDQISLRYGFVDSWITSRRFLLDVESNGEIASIWLKTINGDPLAFTYDPESIRSERAHGRLALNVIKLTSK